MEVIAPDVSVAFERTIALPQSMSVIYTDISCNTWYIAAKGTNLFLVFKGGGIGLLQKYSRRVNGLFLSYLRVFLVFGHHLDFGRSGPTFNGDWNSTKGSQYLPKKNLGVVLLVLDDGPVARGKCVDDLLIQGPEGIPFQRDDGLGGALQQHVLCEGLDSKTASTNTYSRRLAHVGDLEHAEYTSDGGEAWIIPPSYKLVVHEPVQLALGE